jgi:uncharacterized FlaG/YvyC family protein
MQIDPTNSPAAPIAVEPLRNDNLQNMRQLVTAVRALNKAESYGQDRELQFTRDPGTKVPVIKIVQSQTGEVIDQIPPEAVLHAFESLQKMRASGSNE